MKMNKYISIVAGLGLMLSISLGCTQASAQGCLRERIRENIEKWLSSRKKASKDSIIVKGRERTYIVYLPPVQHKVRQPLPLVFVLHGGGGNAENATRMSNMNEKADKEGFLVVYPNGTGRQKERFLTWNSGNGCGYAKKHNIDDVAFIRALIEKLENQYNIDPKRIYVTGLSNGSMMAYRLACELSDRIAAIAPVAGSMQCDPCDPSHPVSVIAFHGTADQYAPYYGGGGKRSKEKRVNKPVSSAIGFWVKHNRCSPIPQRDEFGSILCEVYTAGRDGTEVVLYTIKEGGHSWPGGKKGIRYGNVDEPTQEISATDLMWEFFFKHSK